ncbi:MAG TPA: PKD domain-containing protein, partial [Thermoplasmata archaeon]|nr:PKD domain-containing protein [Thermoplasmata archaeon]
MHLRARARDVALVRLGTVLAVVGIAGLLFGGLGWNAPTRTSTTAAAVDSGLRALGTPAIPAPLAGAPTRSMGASVPVVWTGLTNVTLPAPTPRWSFAFAADPPDGVDVLYGGYSWNGSTYMPDNATWTLAGGMWQRDTASNAPPPMVDAAMAYDPDVGAVVLVGGRGLMDERTTTAQTWEFRAGTWTQLSAKLVGSPPAALGASMAYDPLEHALVRFGGYEYPNYVSAWVSNETWLFTNGSWTNASGRFEPPGSIGSAMAYDPAMQAMVLVGGVRSDVFWEDEPGGNSTWEWANGSWSNLSIAAGPDGSVGADLTWDASLGGLVLTGGGTSWYDETVYGSLRTTWVYSGNAWSRADVSGGTPAFPVLGTAEDPTLGGLVSVAIAGVDPTDVRAWELSRAPAISIAASHASVDVGVPVQFSNRLANVSMSTSVVWWFGDRSTSADPSPTHAFTAPGTYLVNATASMVVGNETAFDWATYSIDVVPDPIAVIEPIPSTVDVFENASFIVAARNGTAPFTVNWSFGDGASSSGAWTVAHRYAAAGSYLATATVVDALGVASKRTVGVHVEPFPLVTVAMSHSVIDVGQPIVVRAVTWNGSAPFTYEFAGLPPGCAPADVANLTCMPQDPGQYDVEVTVVDAHG